ncbi:MAG: TolC family protein [Acidobacteriota bacterium]
MRIAIAALAGCFAAAGAPPPEKLTLAEAEALALAIHPAIEAGKLDALAAHTRIDQARSARYPFAVANTTAVGADNESRIGAGALNNPVLYSRIGAGVSVSQNVFDFGRTSHLIESSRASAAASDQRAGATRADVILGVRRAYFSALRAENVLRVAKATVESRSLVVDQVSELVRAQIKTSLDQSFAETNLAEGKLLVASAENERLSAYADLAQAIGRPLPGEVELADVADNDGVPRDLATFRERALQQRPELKAIRLELAASREFASAERAARYPSAAVVVSAGVVPAGGPKLSTEYAAAGVNLSLPFFNGGLYKARQAEADLRARAIERRVAQLENGITRDVSAAWLDANTASQRIELTRQFVDQAGLALELAQTRYDLGLSTIIELSQAQLTKTNAEIQNTAAKYDYQIRKSILEYFSGGL